MANHTIICHYSPSYTMFLRAIIRISELWVLKELKTKGTAVQKLSVQNHISIKSVGTKSVFFKICGCSCTHSNEDPVLYFLMNTYYVILHTRSWSAYMTNSIMYAINHPFLLQYLRPCLDGC